jgi:hypothetical protein
MLGSSSSFLKMSIAFSHGGFKLHVHAISAKQANAVASDIHFFEKIAAEIACIESMYMYGNMIRKHTRPGAGLESGAIN